jgi:hypothetical protein
MNFEFFKKNIFFTIITICFGIWIAILAIGGVSASREVTFINALPTTHEVSDYTSIIPLARYFFEPFIGTTFTIGEGYSIILAFLVVYAIIRVAYIIIREKIVVKSEKFTHLINFIRTYLWYVFIVFLLLYAGMGSYLGIGYAFLGFHFINDHWMNTILYGITVSFIVILIILGIMIVQLVRPKSRLKLERDYIPTRTRTKILKVTGKEFRFLFIAMTLFLGLSFLSLTINYPTQVIQTHLDSDQYLFDFHVHTTMSDGYLTPEARVDWYISQNISGAAFTDHDNQRGYERAKAYVQAHGLNFIVIPGEEYTYHALDIHLNIFCIEETLIPPDEAVPNNEGWSYNVMNVSEMISYVKAHGGYVFVNHYTGSPGSPYTYVQLRDWGVDGFEIINSGHEQSDAIRQFCLVNNLTCIAGSDQHTNSPLNTLTKLRLNVTANDPTNFTNIFVNLRQNKHEAVYISYPQKVNLPDTSGLLDPLNNFINYYLNLNGFQVLSWILWSIGGYFLFTLVYILFKRINLTKLKEKIEYKESTQN